MKCGVLKQLLHKENDQMVQPLLTLPEQHSFGDKQPVPATEYAGCLCAKHDLILRNTSEVLETPIVVFLSLKQTKKKEPEREMERDLIKF